MTPDQVAAALEAIKDKRALVIGDVMLDVDLHGTADRMSAEAPVPILRFDRRESRLGGAGNAALNMVALGMDVTFCSVVGGDDAGVELLSQKRPKALRHWWVIEDRHRETTIKTRVFSQGHQMLRIDRERVEPISAETEKRFLDNIAAAMGQAGVVLVSDYAKGVYTEAVAEHVAHIAEEKRIPLVIDPKPVNWYLYEGATAITPNRAELLELARLWSDMGETPVEVGHATCLLRRVTGLDAILATLGSHGVMIDYSDGDSEVERWLPALCDAPVDVTGAGDTVSAAFAACMAAHIPVDEAAEIGNLAASVVVQKHGCAVATPDDIVHAVKNILTNAAAA